ncbi:MAG: prepilin-type N-terminal cleavage/methylation domain-containing protein [Kiritimatiellia bacterium]
MIKTIRLECRQNAGFSLLELLAVMSVMALLTTLAVTSYFSAVRGMGRRSAVNNLANTLIQARQMACMDNTRVSVVCFNDITGNEDEDFRPTYVMCKGIGRISDKVGNKLVDEFTALDTIFGEEIHSGSYGGAMKLYNLTRGGFSFVNLGVEKYRLDDRYAPVSGMDRDINAYAFEINNNIPARGNVSWEIGDSYGVEAAPAQTLPRSFQFSTIGSSKTKVEFVTFLPDGRATSGESFTIEEINSPYKKNTIDVSQAGGIKYDEDWN